MKHFFCRLVILFYFFISFAGAQPLLELNGIILNSKDSTPISYAHVGIPSLGVGVITNEIGVFRLNYRSRSVLDTLQVSHMSFESYNVALIDIKDTNVLKIYLIPDVYQLEEIVVTPNPDSAKLVLREAISRLKENYPTKLYQMNAFYREKTQNHDDYRFTRLLEGMVDIRDWGVTAKPERIRVKLNEFRKSEDLAQYTFGQQIWNTLFGERNRLYQIMLKDPIRIHFHNSTKKGRYKFGRYWLKGVFIEPCSSIWISNITTYNGNKVYHLKFRYASHSGSIFIDSTDYGIYHIELYMTLNIDLPCVDTSLLSSSQRRRVEEGLRTIKATMYKNNYLEKVKVDYKKMKGKYYLSYIEWIDLGNFRKSSVEKGKTTASYTTSILMINSVQWNKRQMVKVKRKHMLDHDQDLNELKMKYNKNFWKSYNVLVATPLEKELVKDLEFEKSLEQQFEENSN